MSTRGKQIFCPQTSSVMPSVLAMIPSCPQMALVYLPCTLPWVACHWGPRSGVYDTGLTPMTGTWMRYVAGCTMRSHQWYRPIRQGARWQLPPATIRCSRSCTWGIHLTSGSTVTTRWEIGRRNTTEERDIGLRQTKQNAPQWQSDMKCLGFFFSTVLFR